MTLAVANCRPSQKTLSLVDYLEYGASVESVAKMTRVTMNSEIQIRKMILALVGNERHSQGFCLSKVRCIRGGYQHESSSERNRASKRSLSLTESQRVIVQLQST